MNTVPANRYVVFCVLAITGCSIDLATKSWIFGALGAPPSHVHWLWPDYFGLETSLNAGALFGLGQGQAIPFAILSVVAALGILYWLFYARAATDWILTIALGLVTGGILGNLYDRLNLHGLVWQWHVEPSLIGKPAYAVRDWILVQASPDLKWPNFNIADSLLVCGAALLLWHAFFVHQPDHEQADT